MKSLLKKFCVLFAAVVTASFCRFSCVSASSLPIDETIFPDMYFREYILKTIDTNKDCELSEQEIAAVDTIHTGWGEGTRETPEAVKNFQGIEYFTELKTLWIQNMHHTEPDSYEQSDEGIDIWLDVSKNIKLRTIECEAGKIDKLDLSVLPDLRWIRVDAIEPRTRFIRKYWIDKY